MEIYKRLIRRWCSRSKRSYRKVGGKVRKKPNGMMELNIGVLADLTSVLWEYRNGLLEISNLCNYSINITLAKDAETCQRVMTFLAGGYDLLIIDSTRYERQEEQLLRFFYEKTDSLHILIHRNNNFYLRSFTEKGEAPIQLLERNQQERLEDLLTVTLNQVYVEELQITLC